ncbi:MAG TPA: bifunctional phosphoribosyl-AMP cyclohydrolase/phosphoribosyl-ATP diphosphatase HisIE [Longimicrobiales bacterium]
MRIDTPSDIGTLDFESGGGLIPVVAQHAWTGEVLMLAYANCEALARTLETGEMWYWSRSRGRLWHKGETSGNVQRVVSLHADCDGDAVVARVVPTGPSCHTGDWSCFAAAPPLAALARVLAERAARAAADARAPSPPAGTSAVPGVVEATGAPAAGAPATAPRAGSYTARLLRDRNLRLKKLGEEAVELAMACADGDRERAAEEAADLVYHALVAALGAGAAPDDVLAALERRLPAGG